MSSDTGAPRLLALDVDGTLLTSQHRISPTTRRAIRQAAESGISIVLASARSPRALRPLLAELGLLGWVIAYGGGLVCRLDADPNSPADIISERRLSLEAAREVARSALKDHLSVGWFVGENWHIAGWDATLRHEAAIIRMPPILTPGLAGLAAPHKLQCMVADDSQVDKLARLLRALPPGCYGQFSHNTYLEVIASGIDKATGLEQLGKSLGISLSEMAAIGDGENDMPMLARVGLGVAMGNAPPSVQRAAAWVTASNDQEGVAAAIGRILAGDYRP